MKKTNRPFYKGIVGFSRELEEDYGSAAEEGIYGWWWRYLRLSPVFWFARTTGIAPRNAQLAKVLEQAGDLGEERFIKWWKATGALVPTVIVTGTDISLSLMLGPLLVSFITTVVGMAFWIASVVEVEAATVFTEFCI